MPTEINNARHGVWTDMIEVNNRVFYDIMNYEVPQPKELFFLSLDIKDKAFYVFPKKESEFPRQNKSEIFEEFINRINKWWFLYKSIPFVKSIYLCNSITFNKIDENSDIDIFIVCKEKRLWIARFFSNLFFFLFRLKRHWKKVAKRFCLSFYITDTDLNLYNFTLKPYDLYFIYWIVHLVPLYAEDIDSKDEIYKSNKWISESLININLTQNIFLGNKLFTGRSFIKNILEKLYNWKFGNLTEKLIKFFRLPIMLFKNQRLWAKASGVSIWEDHLKFYWWDIRKKVNLKFKLIRGY